MRRWLPPAACWVEKSPKVKRDQQKGVASFTLDTRDSPQSSPALVLQQVLGFPATIFGVPSYWESGFLRPLAIVPATPSTRLACAREDPKDGLCGPEQRNGVGSSGGFFLSGKDLRREDARSPSTVFVWFVVLIYRREAGKAFVGDASAFSFFRVSARNFGDLSSARLARLGSFRMREFVRISFVSS
jgi:hypothetical protein